MDYLEKMVSGKLKSHKCCGHWARQWFADFPNSEHNPQCENYKTEKFIKVTIEKSDSFMIIEPKDRKDYDGVELFDEDFFKLEDILITRDQFENLNEFGGW